VTASGRKSLFILSFTLLVVMLGYGIAMPMLPFYIEKFGVGGKEFGWMMASYSFMQLICAPLWGLLSDRFGRKPILAVGVLGYAVSFFMFGMANPSACCSSRAPCRGCCPRPLTRPPWPTWATMPSPTSAARAWASWAP